MADTSEAAAQLRLSRVQALSGQDHVALVTYLLARYPNTFPDMLDDALSAIGAGVGAHLSAHPQRRVGRPRPGFAYSRQA
jgi:hypothetical protein